MSAEVIEGDCLEVLRGMGDGSVDAVVTDPPYGLSFMGKRWDYDVPTVEVWAECLRVLKPGGHLLAFAGTRTQHRMAVRIEDAGFEIRDLIAWVYGSGFPKSLDVSKAIDAALGADREVVGPNRWGGGESVNCYGVKSRPPATAPAAQWDGWGTALKPALEPITVARKPLCGTVAANVLEHGTGGLNVGACRVAISAQDAANIERQVLGYNGARSIGGNGSLGGGAVVDRGEYSAAAGRWPANLIHDGSEEVLGLFPETKSGNPMNRMHTDPGRVVASGASEGGSYFHSGFGDSGSAARFFYCAKASKADREAGCEALVQRVLARSCQAAAEAERGNVVDAAGGAFNQARRVRNNHPTVKPTALMRYLCRLVTPPGGLVLDPFCGSGSTGRGAVLEGFRFVGIERESEYVEIARARIAAAADDAGASTELRIENCELRKSEGQGIGRRGRNGTDGGQCDLFELLEVAR